MADLPECSSSNEPYPYAYHYADDILSFIEFSDGSYQTPYAYHCDINNPGPYFVELKDGSVLSEITDALSTLLKRYESSEKSSVRLTLEPVFYPQFNEDFDEPGVFSDWDKEFPELHNGVQVFDKSTQRATDSCQAVSLGYNWDEDFPELGVAYNRVVQVFDRSPQLATHTSKGEASVATEVAKTCDNYSKDEALGKKKDNEKGNSGQETKEKETAPKYAGESEKKRVSVSEEHGSSTSSSVSAIQCMDRLCEELSCAICLEICFEPSTTSCGHSFCAKCLRSAADNCGGRCPKCRRSISNGRSCTINTVLWVVEARKAAQAFNWWSSRSSKFSNNC